MRPIEQGTQILEKVRELRNAHPFVPFTVVVDDGRRFFVDKPYRLAIAPSGSEISYATSDKWFDRIPTVRVTEVLRDSA